MAHSRLRRSISCIMAGLLIVGPITVFSWGTLAEWYPHGIVILILATLCIAGIIWLYDEIRDIRAEQKRASAASENPFRAWNPEAFNKGAKINRWADEFRRVAAKELTGNEIMAALVIALGNEVAARVFQKDPSYSPDQREYWIDEMLDEARIIMREQAYRAANLPSQPEQHEERELTSEEFQALTLRITNAATKEHNIPVTDVLAATAMALGRMICVFSERRGASAEGWLKWAQQAVAEATQDALTQRASEKKSG
jgi:hypothetical protein